MTLTITSRELAIEVAHNVRHLGGYVTSDGRTTAPGLVRSAGLSRLAPAGLQAFADHGISTIIDLRSSAERGREVTPNPAPYGLRHVFAPVFEEDASPAGLGEKFAGFSVVYPSMLETGRNAYRVLFETIAESEGGVVFHCAAGKDRTGVAAALLLEVAGVSEEQILEDYALSEALLAPLVNDWLPRMKERGIDPERGKLLLGSNPADMAHTLKHIRERYGSAEGYAAAIGVSTDVVSAVRARMVG